MLYMRWWILAHQTRFPGEVFKLPKGALVKSYSAERLGKGIKICQMEIKEMSENEPLMKCRDLEQVVKTIQ